MALTEKFQRFDQFFRDCIREDQFLTILEQSKVTHQTIKNWFSDSDHGFAHSYFVSFQAFNLKYKTLEEYDNEDVLLLASCLFHDVVKAIHPGNSHHDTKLRIYMPGLLEAAYTHYTSPISDHYLVRADRLELLRYRDAHKWVDYGKLDPIDDMQKEFYSSFRYKVLEEIESGKLASRFLLQDRWTTRVLTHQ